MTHEEAVRRWSALVCALLLSAGLGVTEATARSTVGPSVPATGFAGTITHSTSSGNASGTQSFTVTWTVFDELLNPESLTFPNPSFVMAGDYTVSYRNAGYDLCPDGTKAPYEQLGSGLGSGQVLVRYGIDDDPYSYRVSVFPDGGAHHAVAEPASSRCGTHAGGDVGTPSFSLEGSGGSDYTCVAPAEGTSLCRDIDAGVDGQSALRLDPTSGTVGTDIGISGVCPLADIADNAGDAVGLYRSDGALLDAEVQLGNGQTDPTQWQTALTVSPTAFDGSPTTPGAYEVRLFCEIGSSFRDPGESDATPRDTADVIEPFTVLGGTEPVADPPGTTRLAGADRYATAAAIVQHSFPNAPVPVVFIATGESFADALAGGPAADVLGGPVLPVARVGVPAPIRAELTRLQPGRILVLGGREAVSDAIAAELEGFTTGTVTRLAGPNRYDTAATVATTVFSAPVPQALIATGLGFADALAGGAVGARTDSPVLLVAPDRLPAETAAALRQLQPRDITVLGGTGVVSDAVLNALRPFAVGGGVTRLAGGDRYATAARLAQMVWPTTSPVVYLATGRNFPDALAGVPAAGREQAPLLLTEPDCMPRATKQELDRLQPSTTVILGGTATVSPHAAGGLICVASG